MKNTVAVFFFLFLSAAGNFSYGQLWKEYSDSAKLFRDQRDNDMALEYYTKAKKLIPKDSVYTETYIRITKNLAELFFLAGESDQASLAGSELITIIEKLHGEINADFAWTCNLLGVIYNGYGQLDTAKAFHLKATTIREKLFGKNDPAYAQSCNSLGALYIDLGQYELAEPLLLEAKAIREKITPPKQSAGYAITCVTLANLYMDMGQYVKAEALYLEAKEIRALMSPVKQHPEYAALCNKLADLYTYMYQYEKAEALYLEAKAIREKIGKETYNYGQSCNNLAVLYSDMGQLEKAKALALEAKAVYEKTLPDKEHPSRIINLNNLGQVYYMMGRYQDAESFFLQARQLWKKKLGENHPYSIANSEELARVYWNTNETTRANNLFTEVSRLKYRQLNKIFQFTNENEKQLYLKNINGSGDEYQSFFYKKMAYNKAAQPFALSLLNRNLILSSAQQTKQAIYNSKDVALTQSYNDWTNVKEQLANLYGKGSDAKTEQVKALEEKADVIEKELSRRSSAFKKLQRKSGWQDIRQALRQNEAAIEFVEFRLNDGKQETDSFLYAALLLKKGLSEPMLIPLFEKKQLDKLLDQGPSDEVSVINLRYSSPALFNMIWRPMEKYLAGITKIYFAPAGNLFRISFGALPMNAKQVLSDKYQLIQLNTTAAVTDQVQSHITATDKIQLYGGILYDADTASLKKAAMAYDNIDKPSRSVPDDLTRGKSFQYLPGTAEEVNAIKKQAEKTGVAIAVVSGINASEESLYSLNGSSSPAILHIATHGFFFPDPKKDTRDSIQRKFEISGRAFRESGDPLFRTGLLFAGANTTWRGQRINGIQDGIVTAYEVGTTMYLPNTKLVVLSACETALGDIEGSEGVYGLQRAFKMAGVQNLVMSLWKVPDAETSAFMQVFYRNMFNKQSVSDAFYNAQNSMKIKYRNDPYKWAAWVLVR
jgi:CHAT domain-containing protein